MLHAAQGKVIRYILGTSGGSGVIYQVSVAHPVLKLPAVYQGPHCHVYISFGAVDPQAESLLSIETISYHSDAVGLLRVVPCRATGLEHHTHRISYVDAQPNPFKQLRQDVKHPLYPFFAFIPGEIIWHINMPPAVICPIQNPLCRVSLSPLLLPLQ